MDSIEASTDWTRPASVRPGHHPVSFGCSERGSVGSKPVAMSPPILPRLACERAVGGAHPTIQPRSVLALLAFAVVIVEEVLVVVLVVPIDGHTNQPDEWADVD